MSPDSGLSDLRCKACEQGACSSFIEDGRESADMQAAAAQQHSQPTAQTPMQLQLDMQLLGFAGEGATLAEHCLWALEDSGEVYKVTASAVRDSHVLLLSWADVQQCLKDLPPGGLAEGQMSNHFLPYL